MCGLKSLTNISALTADNTTEASVRTDAAISTSEASVEATEVQAGRSVREGASEATEVLVLRDVNRDGNWPIDKDFDGDRDRSLDVPDYFKRLGNGAVLDNFNSDLLDALDRDFDITVDGDSADLWDVNVNIAGNLARDLDGVGPGVIDKHGDLDGNINIDGVRSWNGDLDINTNGVGSRNWDLDGDIDVVRSGDGHGNGVLSRDRNSDLFRLGVHDAFDIVRNGVGDRDADFLVKILLDTNGDSALDHAFN